MPGTEGRLVSETVAGGQKLWSRSFVGITLSTLISSLGDGAALVGLPLLAASLNRSPLVVALVVVAQRVPWLFSIVTGTITDRVRLRRYVAEIEGTRMAVVASLGLCVAVHFHPLIAIFVVATLLGTTESAFFAATGRMVLEAVAIADLGTANGYLYASQMSSSVAGQAVGGLLAPVSLALPFLVDGASFGLSALLLVGLAIGPTRGEPTSTEGSLRDGMRQGWGWFARHPALIVTSSYVAVLALCQTMVMSVLVIWALRTIHLTRPGYGLLEAVATSGTLLGALMAGRLVTRFGNGPMLLATAALAAATYWVAGAVDSAVLAGAALFVEQAAVAAGAVANQAMRQQMIPKEMIGRVANITRSMIYGAVPLGALSGGLISTRFGPRVPFFVAGGLQLALVALVGPRMVRLLAADQPA